LGIIIALFVVSPSLIHLYKSFGTEGIRFFLITNNFGRISGGYAGSGTDFFLPAVPVIAVDRNGHKFVNCEVGTRGTETGEKLWEKIRGMVKGRVCADYWKPYESLVPGEQHVQSKAETFTEKGTMASFVIFSQVRKKNDIIKMNYDINTVYQIRQNGMNGLSLKFLNSKTRDKALKKNI